MRKITIIEHISLDGVIQSPGSPDEDRDGDFEYGGWAAPPSDPAVGEAVVAAHNKAFDLLLGRRTYDIWRAAAKRETRALSIHAGFARPRSRSRPRRRLFEAP